MAVTTKVFEHDRGVGSLESLPEKLRRNEVSHAALHVFNNFVEQIARVTPRTITMKKEHTTSSTQLRRSMRFQQHVDSLQQTQVPPLTSCVATPSHRGTAHKVCTLKISILGPTFIEFLQFRIKLHWGLSNCTTKLRWIRNPYSKWYGILPWNLVFSAPGATVPIPRGHGFRPAVLGVRMHGFRSECTVLGGGAATAQACIECAARSSGARASPPEMPFMEWPASPQPPNPADAF